MGQLKISKESLEFATYPEGEYQVQLIGFKPTNSRDKESFNLRPSLRIVNHQQFAGKSLLYNLNTKGTFALRDFVHGFGVLMDGETPEMLAAGEAGDLEFPGIFMPFDERDAAKWGPYNGPLLGRIARVELVVRQRMKKAGDSYVAVPNETQNDIKRFICAVPGCAVAHRENLIKS